MNPFICGTWAHIAWESRTGESNCEKKKEESVRRKKHEPITLPHYNSLDEFYITCGVDPARMKPKSPWGTMPKGWKP